MPTYAVPATLSVPGIANSRYANPSLTEIRRSEKYNQSRPRWIGGDHGDLGFSGFYVEEDEDRTVLSSPVIMTSTEGLTPDEVIDLATEILMASFESIQHECLYSS